MSTERPWRDLPIGFLTADEKAQYEAQFTARDPHASGYIDGRIVQQWLQGSGLPAEAAERIYALSGSSGAGERFSFVDFCLALYLVKRARSGFAVPTSLPQALAKDHARAQALLTEKLDEQARRTLTRARSDSLRKSRENIALSAESLGGGGAAGGGSWRITRDEKARFDKIFSMWAQVGSISGEKAREVFSQSGLAKEDLRRIWTLADARGNGRLNIEEFAVAMHLVYARLNGEQLPALLPPDLVPPSTREMGQLESLMKENVLEGNLDYQRRKSSLTGLTVPQAARTEAADAGDAYVSKHRRKPSQGADAELGASSTAGEQHSQKADSVSSRKVSALQRSQAGESGKASTVGQDRAAQETGAKRLTVQEAQESIAALEAIRKKLLHQLERAQADAEAESNKYAALHAANEVLESELRLKFPSSDTGAAAPAQSAGINNKAAAMLAARMKALGLESLVPAPTAEPANPRLATLRAELEALNGARMAGAPQLDQMRRHADLFLDTAPFAIEPLSLAKWEGSGSPKSLAVETARRDTGPANAPLSPSKKTRVPTKSNEELINKFKDQFPEIAAILTPQTPLPSNLDLSAERETHSPASAAAVPEAPRLPEIPNSSSSAAATAPAGRVSAAVRQASPLKAFSFTDLASAGPAARQSTAPAERTSFDRRPDTGERRGAGTEPIFGAASTSASETKVSPPAKTPKPKITAQQSPAAPPMPPSLATQPSPKVAVLQSAAPHVSPNLAMQPPSDKTAAGVESAAARADVKALASRFGGAAAGAAVPQAQIAQRTSVKPEQPPPSKVDKQQQQPMEDVFGDHNVDTSSDDDDDQHNIFGVASEQASPYAGPMARNVTIDDEDDGDVYPGTGHRGSYSKESASPAIVPRYVVAKAVYPFDASNDDELSLQRDEFVTAFPQEQDDWSPQGSWWWVYSATQKRCGWVPSSWIEVWIRSDESGGDLQYLHPAASYARAAYPFTASAAPNGDGRHDELGMLEGQIIVMLDPASKLSATAAEGGTGWVLACDKGEVGIVPGSYIELLREKPSVAHDDRDVLFGLPSIRERAASLAKSSGGGDADRRSSAGSAPVAAMHLKPDFQSKLNLAVGNAEKKKDKFLPSPPSASVKISSDMTRLFGASMESLNHLNLLEPAAATARHPHSKSSSASQQRQRGGASIDSGAAPAGSPERADGSMQGHTLDLAKLTWSALVQPQSILDRLSKEERRRQEAIFELVKTEATYVHDLQLIVDTFYNPLQNMLTAADLRKIFANVEELLIVNTEILSSFEAVQSRDKFVVQRIAPVFLSHVERLRCYVVYCGWQMSASKFLQAKRKRDKRLGDFLKECQRNPRCRSLDLTSFLLEPMQRITRYFLLLKQILGYTPATHPDYVDLGRALQASEQLTAMTNEAARENENRAKIEEIAQLVDFESANENMPFRASNKTRQFIFEGPLLKAKSGRKIQAVLFNDFLFLLELKNSSVDPSAATEEDGKIYNLYRPPLRVGQTVFRESGGSGGGDGAASADDTLFQIAARTDGGASGGGGEITVNVRAATAGAKAKWIAAMQRARNWKKVVQQNGSSPTAGPSRTTDLLL